MTLCRMGERMKHRFTALNEFRESILR